MSVAPEGDRSLEGGALGDSVIAGAGRRVAAHGVIYVVGTALQGLGVLLVVPLITRTLSRGEYGRASTALVAVQLVGVIAAAGMPQVILREHHRGPEGPRRARTLAGAMLVLAATVAIGGGAIVGAVLGFSGADARLPALVVFASGALTAVVASQALMRAQQRPWAFLGVAVLSTVGAQLAGYVAARAEQTATTFLTAYAVMVLASGIVGILFAPPRSPLRDWAVISGGVRLAAPLLPHAVAMLVLLMGDVLIVSLMLGNESVASYQVALQLGNMPFVLVTALVNAWAPSVYARPAGSRWSWTRTTGTGLALVVAVGGAGVALLAPWLVSIAAPPTYDHDLIVTLVSLIVLVAPAYLIYNGSSLALIDVGQTGRLAVAAAAAAGVLILAGLVAAVAGVEGVAVARVVGYLTLTISCALLAGRQGLRWPGRALTGITVLSLTASAAGALLPTAGPGAGARVAMALLLGIGLVAGLWFRRGRLLASDPHA